MNQGSLGTSLEDRAGALQAPRELNSQGRQPLPLQLNNPGMAFPASQAGFQVLSPAQAQQARLQAMVQMQALQQQQNQLWMAGLLQNTGLYASLSAPSPNALSLPPGVTSLQAVPGPPSTLLEATVHMNAFTRGDEDTFARALCANGEKIGATLNSLNGVNGHTKSQWGSYFLQNSEKIQQKAKLLVDTKTPTPNARSSMDYPRPVRPSDLGDTTRQIREKTRRGGQYAPSHRAPSHRAHNRSPSPVPPTKVMKTRQGGHKYTKEDVAFFKAFLAHTLKYEPDALNKRSGFCKKLTGRVPHHSALSWQSWMRDNKGIIRRVERQVKGEEEEDTESSLSDSDSCSDSQDDDSNEDDALSAVDNDDVSSPSCLRVNEADSASAAPVKKRVKVVYLPEDWQALSRYIATVSVAKWEKEKDWVAFQKMHARHSVTQWMHWYARHKEGITQMAQCFEICNALEEHEAGRSITVTRALHCPSQIPVRSTPSSGRSQESGRTHSVMGKRDYEEDDDSLQMHAQFAKRSKKITEGPKPWVF